MQVRHTNIYSGPGIEPEKSESLAKKNDNRTATEAIVTAGLLIENQLIYRYFICSKPIFIPMQGKRETVFIQYFTKNKLEVLTNLMQYFNVIVRKLLVIIRSL